MRLIFFIFEAYFEAYSSVSLGNQHKEKENIMKNKFNQIVLSASKINRQHIQTIFVLLSLAMLVLGLGAPEDGGLTGR